MPTFRGREKKDAEPLDPTKIYEWVCAVGGEEWRLISRRRLSFMCRSDFGAQEGDFELVVCEVAVEEMESNKRGWWRRLVDAVRGWTASVSGWWRGDGAMRLP